MLKGLNNLLESYEGRDKILRLIGYASQLVSGFTNNKKLSHLNDLISECRTTLRLFDDIPMLTYTLSYGLGKKEPDTYMQVCGVIVNMLDQLYYPLEHVAWAADKGLITQRSNHWWTASNVCWAFSLYFSIARSLRYLSLLHDHSKHLDLSDPSMRNELRDLSEGSVALFGRRVEQSLVLDDQEAEALVQCQDREEYKKNQRLELIELISGIRTACDFAVAIHWMPEGFLWAGMLRDWHIGALGTVSSILSLVQSCTFKPVS